MARHCSKFAVRLFCILFVSALSLAAAGPFGSEMAGGAKRNPGAAEEAYRSGDYGTAGQLWLEELASAEGPGERARLCYNSGNAAYRQGAVLESVAWYTAGLRHAPRDTNLWYNLELARAEAGLDPADRGDLEATTRRVLGALTATESDWLVLVGLLIFALCLAGEALRGGLWVRASWLALGGVVLSTVPWFYGHWSDGQAAVMVVSKTSIPARSEPRPDAKRLIDLEPGTQFERRDSLPGWVKVKVASVGELWVAERSVFELVR